MRENLTGVSLEAILEHVDKMQGIPVVALRANALLDMDESNAKQVAEIVMQDPTLSARILKLANSAMYGLPRKVSTISEAIAIMGSNALKQMLYAIISHSMLNRPVEGYGLEQGALWENAVSCAIFSKAVAKKLAFEPTELVFIAALLRDIGKIALHSFLKGKHIQVQAAALEARSSFADAETQIIGYNHSEIGGCIAERWNFPPNLIRVIQYHHRPAQLPADTDAQTRQLVSIVHVGELFTMMTGKGVGVDGLMYPFDESIIDVLGLPREANVLLESWYVEALDLQDEIDQMLHSFKIDSAKPAGGLR